MTERYYHTICTVDPETNEAHYKIFDDLASRLHWVGDPDHHSDNDMILYLSESSPDCMVGIRFKNFESARKNPAQMNQAKIYLMVGNTEYEIYSCDGHLWKPETREYNLWITDGGGVLQLGNGQYDTEAEQLNDSCTCVVFALINSTYNYKKHTSGYEGLYVPKSRGSISYRGGEYIYNYHDPTPKFFVTGDSKALIENTGLSFTTEGKISAWVPIFGLSSECISTSARVRATGLENGIVWGLAL